VTTPSCHCTATATTAVVVPVSKAQALDFLDVIWASGTTESIVPMTALREPVRDAHDTGPPLDLIVTLRRLVI
jgi:hypothetical protein